MAFRLAALFLIVALFSACENTQSTQPEMKDGILQSAQVQGAVAAIAVGDSVELSAGFTASGPIDSSLLQFAWRLAGADSTFKNLSASDIAKLIPMEPGKYTLNLDITYEGKTVSALIVFVVVEKVVYVDSSRNAQLKVFQEKLPGSYVGTVTTPWLPPYEIAMVFREDGTYSAYNTDTTDITDTTNTIDTMDNIDTMDAMDTTDTADTTDVTATTKIPALYYGMDADDPGKTWVLEDVTAAGNAVGKINVVFDVGTEVEDDIKSMRFSADFEELQFSIYHMGTYGPLKVSLRRIASDDLPPR